MDKYYWHDTSVHDISDAGNTLREILIINLYKQVMKLLMWFYFCD